MSDKGKIKEAIQEVIQVMMDRVLSRVLIEDPFVIEKHRAARPLYAALVPDEIFKGSHFERRFVTQFGGAWERLAVVAANAGLGFGTTNYQIRGNVAEGRLNRISQVLNGLEHPEKGKSRIRPSWENELSFVLDGKGEPIPVSIVCDVYAEDKMRNLKFAFELKSPLPNSDITKVSKEKILKLFSMDPIQIDGAFFALPYNPYGRKEDYNWGFPSRWFDMKNDSVVLIGDEFWEKIGGLGTYQAFISAVNEIGSEYKERIYKDFLGIEPPPHIEEGKL
jgi:hypothetical protein